MNIPKKNTQQQKGANKLYTVENMIEDYHEGKKVFPLQTASSLAERWGVSAETVRNWSKRSEHFPDPVTGLADGSNVHHIYPYYAIVEYEERKVLK